MNEKPTIYYVFAHACIAGDSADESGMWISSLLRLDTSNSKNKDWIPKPKERIPADVAQTILLSKENESHGPWAGFIVIYVFHEEEKKYIDSLISKGDEGRAMVGFVENVCQKIASNYTKV